MFYVALIVLKLLGYVFSFFPRRLVLVLGAGLGASLRAFHFREEIVRENVRRAFPFLTGEQVEKFCREHYRELGILFLELGASFFKFDRFVERICEVEGRENLEKALAQGKGVFVMTAHLGNWEVLTVMGPSFFGKPVTMVTKTLKPAWFHRIVVITRELSGVKMAAEPKTMPAILRALKKNEIVGFVMDQFTGAPVGARVPFFGVPVGSHTALATLALRTGAPVVPAIAVRRPDGRYLARFEPALETIPDPDQEKAVLLNTAQYVRQTESWIKEFPLQWLWIHRRWKGDLSPLPPGAIGEMLK